MQTQHYNHRRSSGKSRGRCRKQAFSVRPRTLRMEMLEHRLVLSTLFLVTNAQDSGDGSLRWAVEQANGTSGADTITFDASLIDQPIVLGGTELTVSDDLSITGLGADNLTISGNNASRVFSIAAGVTVDIAGVTIADGKAYEYENGTAVEGGGIYNQGTLTVADCTLTNNAAWWDGGAIYNLATLIVIDSILSSNSAGSWGGAICNYSPDAGFPSSVTITNSTLTLNEGDEGGAIWSDGLLKATDSVFSTNSSWSTGGAVWNSGTLDITNGTLTGNCTDGKGGGIYNEGTLNVENSTLTGNSAYGEGGGIYNAGTLNVESCMFTENGAGWDGGGAIASNTNSDATITGSTFSKNGGEYLPYGGAILKREGGNMAITASTFSENEASRGGAVFAFSWSYSATRAQIGITGSTFSDNHARSWGGAIGTWLKNDTVEIKDSTLSGNWTTYWGGGAIANMAAASAMFSISNSTISGNSARAEGGAIYNWGGTLEITNSTLTGNRADAYGDPLYSFHGGGLYHDAGDPGTSTYRLHNTIVAGNLVGAPGSDSPDDLYLFAATLDPASSHNLIGHAGTASGLNDSVNGNIVGNEGEGTIDITTVLDPNLANNGGPTLTHALVPGGPAVNGGNNGAAVGDYDQRGEGFARIVDGVVDIGAFEVQPQIRSVEIDVKPASDPNSINLTSNGLIAVAIFTTDDFDASLVNASTVLFAGACAVQSAMEDVDGDGDLDMVLHFRVQETNLADIYAQLLADDIDVDGVLDSNRQTAAVSLTGQTATDECFEGFDDVDLFLAGRNLRDFLADLALAGAI